MQSTTQSTGTKYLSPQPQPQETEEAGAMAAAAASGTPTNKKQPRRSLLSPTPLALAVLGGAAAALVARLLQGPAHDPSTPSHFLSSKGAIAAALLGPGVTAARVPIDLCGVHVQSTVLLAPAATSPPPAATKPLVVLLHGFPDDAATFHAQAPALTAAGYDVLVPVLPGYEPATAGLGPEAYALPAVAQALGQAAAWGMRELGKDKVHIVGHDWGAVLTYAMASAGGPLEGRVASVVTLAVPHNAVEGIAQYPYQIVHSWYMLFFQLPLLPELWLRAASHVGLRRLWKQWSPGYPPPAAVWDSVIATLEEPGVLRAALQYYRTNVPGMLRRILGQMLGLKGKQQAASSVTPVVRAPTLGILGMQDGCIAPRLWDLTMGGDGERGDEAVRHDHPLFPGGVQVAKLQGCGHFAHQEKPEEVNALVLAWFARHEG